MTPRMLLFLRPRHGEEDGDRVLVVQSGAPALAARLVQLLRERTPHSRIALLVRRGAESALPPLPDVEIIPNEGPRLGFVKKLQDARYDRAYVMLTGEPQPWKLKLLPFTIGAGVVYAVNENLHWFEVSTRHTPSLAHHLRARFESSLTHAGPAAGLLRRAASTAAYPAVLAYLLAWEQLRTRDAERRGARDWKSENRPRTAPVKRDEAA